MKIVHIVVGVLSLGLTGSAAIWGIWCWYRARSSRVFWWLLRAGQGFIVLEAILGGIWVASGRHASELHLIYGLVPIAVSFVAGSTSVFARCSPRRALIRLDFPAFT